MNETSLLYHALLVGAARVGIGLVGFLSRRNMIVMFLSAEMMLQGVSLSLVAWGRFHNDWGGQVLTIFILTVAACEAAVALALIITLYRRNNSLDISLWQELREPGQDPTLDEEPLPQEEREDAMPRLTPAGPEPRPREETTSHV